MSSDERDELPDVFEVRKGYELGDAIMAGDDTRAEQIRRHIVAESAVDVGEEAVLDEVSRAARDFRQACEARDRGDDATADALMDKLKATYSRATLDTILSAAHFQVGMQRGWLPADDHDRLTRWAAATGIGPELRAMIDRIERQDGPIGGQPW